MSVLEAYLCCLINIYTPPLRTFFFFFFNDTATTEIYTLSLHDALPISPVVTRVGSLGCHPERSEGSSSRGTQDRKSTRLNSSHSQISYAVFCLKKKKTNNYNFNRRLDVSLLHDLSYLSIRVEM